MIKSISAALLAAALVFGVNTLSLAQTAPPTRIAKAKSPTAATGSGKDTGMNVQSGMSGNGPGGVGTAANPHATSAAPTTGKSSASKSKKSARHMKKHSATR